jgi:hypothetical protein
VGRSALIIRVSANGRPLPFREACVPCFQLGGGFCCWGLSSYDAHQHHRSMFRTSASVLVPEAAADADVVNVHVSTTGNEVDLGCPS